MVTDGRAQSASRNVSQWGRIMCASFLLNHDPENPQRHQSQPLRQVLFLRDLILYNISSYGCAGFHTGSFGWRLWFMCNRRLLSGGSRTLVGVTEPCRQDMEKDNLTVSNIQLYVWKKDEDVRVWEGSYITAATQQSEEGMDYWIQLFEQLKDEIRRFLWVKTTFLAFVNI